MLTNSRRASKNDTPQELDDPRLPLLHDPLRRDPKVHVMLLITLAMAMVGVIGVALGLIVAAVGWPGGVDSVMVQFELVNRTMWQSRLARDTSPLLVQPATRVVVLHTVTPQCFTMEDCAQQVRDLQAEHIDHYGMGDISFNFLIGGDGRTYEGRGWETEGDFASLLTNRALGVAFIGNFEKTTPGPKQLAEARLFLSESVKRKKLYAGYQLVGARQLDETESPGQKLYDIIKTWQHWEDCYKTNC